MSRARFQILGLAAGVLLMAFLPGQTFVTGGGCGASSETTEPAGEATTNDSDADGVLNSEDNCPVFYNPRQTDEDADGVGEVCEPFEAFDGVIHCDFQPCDVTDDCHAQLDGCPGAEMEMNFTGRFVVCCDQACVVRSQEDTQSATGPCPEGTCFDSAPHCESGSDCEGGHPDSCQAGCCLQGFGTAPECGPTCPNGGPSPQCGSGGIEPPSRSPPALTVKQQVPAPEPVPGPEPVPSECAPGEGCDPCGCCVPGDGGEEACGNGVCEPEFGECELPCEVDCLPEACVTTGCTDAPTCEEAMLETGNPDPAAACDELAKQIFCAPEAPDCIAATCEAGCCLLLDAPPLLVMPPTP